MRCFGLALLFWALAPPALAADPLIDVRHYDLAVALRERSLEVTAELTVNALAPPRRWLLDLASRMEVRAVKAGDRTVPHEARDGKLVLDLSGLEGPDLKITIEARGAPYNRFSEKRGGFVRTAVGPEHTYIRSQYPWYPRVADDPATYRTEVNVREGWLVRTAGHQDTVADRGVRKLWTFIQERPCRGIGLVAGPYKLVEAKAAGDFKLDAFCLAGHEQRAEKLLGVARTAFELYTRWFGPVSASRFSLVEVPAAFGKGSGYSEEGYVLIGTGAFTSTIDVEWADDLVAHEVAHTWWGREVTFAHFASEALASYATLRYVEAARGAKAAAAQRRKAVEAVLRIAATGREIALKDIRGFGLGLDPSVYRVHAYEKGMMLLSMLGDAAGREKLDRMLAGFLDDHRGEAVGWAALRTALAKGAAGSALVRQWENPGIPAVGMEYKIAKSGKQWRIKGVLTQSGTKKPFKLQVPVRAIAGEKSAEAVVKLTGKKAAFTLKLDAKPYGVLLDPDYRVLLDRPTESKSDIDQEVSAAFKIVNDPKEDDRDKLSDVVQSLRSLLRRGAGEHEGLCHTGIARCLFRLGDHDDAMTDFKEALRLGAGGPFHQRWIHLRLGCIADLAGKRGEAEKHYRKVLAFNKSDYQTRLAQRFLDRPYRGYAKDG